MSSRVFQGGSPRVEGVLWRRAGEPEPGPGQGARAGTDLSPDAGGAEGETSRLREALASLERQIAALTGEHQQREAHVLEAGRRQGLAQGRKEGEAAAVGESNRALAAVRAEAAERTAASATQMVEMRRRLRQQMEADLVQLAVAIARRILRRELSVDPEALMGIVKSAVERIASRELLAIRVAPDDAARVSARLAELRLPDRVEVAADTSLSWGSVLIDTSRGQQDASVATQIEEIDRGLAELVGRSGDRRT